MSSPKIAQAYAHSDRVSPLTCFTQVTLGCACAGPRAGRLTSQTVTRIRCLILLAVLFFFPHVAPFIKEHYGWKTQALDMGGVDLGADDVPAVEAGMDDIGTAVPHEGDDKPDENLDADGRDGGDAGVGASGDDSGGGVPARDVEQEQTHEQQQHRQEQVAAGASQLGRVSNVADVLSDDASVDALYQQLTGGIDPTTLQTAGLDDGVLSERLSTILANSNAAGAAQSALLSGSQVDSALMGRGDGIGTAIVDAAGAFTSVQQLRDGEVVDGIRDAGGIRTDEMSEGEAKLTIEQRFAEAYKISQSEEGGGASGDEAEATRNAAKALKEEEMIRGSDPGEERTSWQASEEYQNSNIMIQDGKEYERVGDEWVIVEIRDPKQRSEEEKKIVLAEKTEKMASRDDRKSWLQARLQKAGLSKETATAMAEGRVSDAMKGGKLSVEEVAQKEKRNEAIRNAEKEEAELAANDDSKDAGDITPSDGVMTWFDRPSIRQKLDAKRFVQCAKKRSSDSLPSAKGIPLPTLPVKDYLWRPNPNPVEGTEEFDAGPIALEAAVSANSKALLVKELKRSPLRRSSWGNCAIVGNSGLLRLSTFGKSIDSHDTVVRVNQAPMRGYSRRVGLKVTHRVLNRLWTRNYYTGASKTRNKATEQHPLEDNLTLLITRASVKEYGLLSMQLAETRPDILPVRISSRACSMAQPVLEEYRERLCQSGFGPYKGLNVPSSGWVAANMMANLCSKVTVYGFGVEGLGKFSRGIGIDPAGDGAGQKRFQAGGENLTYHYFHGLGARKEGNDVHSFDTEERAFEALATENHWEFCKFRENGGDHNWKCGCVANDVEQCRPDSLGGSYAGMELEVDCTPGKDCPEDELKRKAAEMEARAKEMANAGNGGDDHRRGKHKLRGDDHGHVKIVKTEVVKAEDNLAKETASRLLEEEERLLAKEEAIEEQTQAMRNRRQAQERSMMQQYEEMKKTQSDIDAIDKSRVAMMAKLEAKERHLREKERALAERKIDLAKKLRATKESELSEMQLRMLEKNAKEITAMKADLQREYNQRENDMAEEIERVRLLERRRFAHKEVELMEQQQAETAKVRKEEERKAAVALEAQKFAAQQQIAAQRQQALAQQALAQQASQRLQTKQASLADSQAQLAQLAAMAEEGQAKAKELEQEKVLLAQTLLAQDQQLKHAQEEAILQVQQREKELAYESSIVAGTLEQKVADLQHKLAEQETETKLREAEIQSVKAAKDKELNHFKSMAAQELAAVQAMAAQHANAADTITKTKFSEAEMLRAEVARLKAEKAKSEADFAKAQQYLQQAQDQAQQLLAITAKEHNERLRAERQAQEELERAEMVAEAAKRTQEVAQEAIKLSAQEKAELARRWELDRQQKETAWAEQQLLLAREKEEAEARLRAEADGLIERERQHWQEQQATLKAAREKEFDQYRTKVTQELLKEKAENQRLATLKERVQARLNDEEKQALAAIREKEEEVLKAQEKAEAERLKAEKATVLIKEALKYGQDSKSMMEQAMAQAKAEKSRAEAAQRKAEQTAATAAAAVRVSEAEKRAAVAQATQRAKAAEEAAEQRASQALAEADRRVRESQDDAERLARDTLQEAARAKAAASAEAAAVERRAVAERNRLTSEREKVEALLRDERERHMQDIREAEGEERGESVAELEHRLDELRRLEQKQDVKEVKDKAQARKKAEEQGEKFNVALAHLEHRQQERKKKEGGHLGGSSRGGSKAGGSGGGNGGSDGREEREKERARRAEEGHKNALRAKRDEAALEDKLLKRLERASREDAHRLRSSGGGFH